MGEKKINRSGDNIECSVTMGNLFRWDFNDTTDKLFLSLGILKSEPELQISPPFFISTYLWICVT